MFREIRRIPPLSCPADVARKTCLSLDLTKCGQRALPGGGVFAPREPGKLRAQRHVGRVREMPQQMMRELPPDQLTPKRLIRNRFPHPPWRNFAEVKVRRKPGCPFKIGPVTLCVVLTDTFGEVGDQPLRARLASRSPPAQSMVGSKPKSSKDEDRSGALRAPPLAFICGKGRTQCAPTYLFRHAR